MKDFWQLTIPTLFLVALASFFFAKESFLDARLHNMIGVGVRTNTDTEIALEAQGDQPLKETVSISAEELKICLARPGSEINNCLDSLFRKYLEKKTPVEALALVEELGNYDSKIRFSCHPIVHAIGRETFKKEGTIPDSFAACDQTCHSGCYHGAIERFLRGEEQNSDGVGHLSQEEIAQKVKGACSAQEEVRFHFQCLHGLGHAVMFFLDYDLEESLEICEDTGDNWSQSSCRGGVFMENMFSSSPEKRDFSLDDYHYPCSKLEEKYKADCYMMQTSRMSEMGLGLEGLFTECRKAENFVANCFQSIGRDLSNDARINDPRITSKKCEGLEVREQDACIRGVIYALMDNTWNGRYAFPFCESFEEMAPKMYCFSASASYLSNTFVKTGQELLKDCQTWAPSSEVCLATVGY
ncbi:MAG: hypothetical protein G01um101430_355 [Parcubacteria group bacterium Gr01-1014_30]|nr:MAG: hypothetical protein G01um101430_355 [Parcubacteria group bacterium Gr01-1014_30]